MAIAFNKYVSIISAVGGADAVPTRELIGRLFVDNELIPTDGIVEMTTLADVAQFFGSNSQEYKRARFYFGFVSKQITSPKKISFARWNRDDVPPMIIGGSGVSTTLADWQSMSLGEGFFLTIGGDTVEITGIDYSSVTSMADVANALQTAIQTLGVAYGTQWTACTVTFDAVRKAFVFTGGDPVLAGKVEISTEASITSPNTLYNRYRWTGVTSGSVFTDNLARFSAGRFKQFPNNAFVESADKNNNFGSFLFIDAITDDEKVLVAQDNSARNVEFIYTLAALTSDVELITESLQGIAGTCVTMLDGDVAAPADEYPEMLPMAILASTDYNRPDASQNYMFQQANLTPVVLNTTTSDFLDAYRVNYYGATQRAGRLIAFYQRGYMQGDMNDPLDINTYANEIWLKDRVGFELMNLLLALGKISANRQGRATVISGIQVAVNLALSNGVISVGKLLSNTQKQYINSLTANVDAWRQVQDSGYWLDCVIEQDENTQDYKARYILIYSKDDAIRKIEGTHVLI